MEGPLETVVVRAPTWGAKRTLSPVLEPCRRQVCRVSSDLGRKALFIPCFSPGKGLSDSSGDLRLSAPQSRPSRPQEADPSGLEGPKSPFPASLFFIFAIPLTLLAPPRPRKPCH